MRLIIKDIMKLLKVDKTTAEEVVQDMRVDFSEATQREINMDARITYEVIKSRVIIVKEGERWMIKSFIMNALNVSLTL